MSTWKLPVTFFSHCSTGWCSTPTLLLICSARHLWVKIVIRCSFPVTMQRCKVQLSIWKKWFNGDESHGIESVKKLTNKTNVSQVSGRRPFKDTSLKHSRALCHFVDVRVPRVEMHELKITRFCSSNFTLNLGKAGCVWASRYPPKSQVKS